MTGRESWRALSARQPGDCPPVVRLIGGKEQLLIWHSDALESLNPENGAGYWSVQIKPTYAMSIGQPVVEGNRVYVMGYNRVSACVVLRWLKTVERPSCSGKATPGVGLQGCTTQPSSMMV